MSAQFDQVRREGLDQNARTWNLVQSELEELKWLNHYLKWGELILIQSKDWINFDPVLGSDQYTSPGIQYYHVNKIKQYGWLIYSWIINGLKDKVKSLTMDKRKTFIVLYWLSYPQVV
jgi:hypothetical protein